MAEYVPYLVAFTVFVVIYAVAMFMVGTLASMIVAPVTALIGAIFAFIIVWKCFEGVEGAND